MLEAGAVDRQQPHTEDEVYVVLAGRSRFTAGYETRDVAPGRHASSWLRACRIGSTTSSEALRLIVVFGPAEGSRAR